MNYTEKPKPTIKREFVLHPQPAIPNLENISNKFDLINQRIEELYDKLHYKINEIVVEGLKKKGFEFKNKFEVEQFIVANCRCVDNTETKQRIYFVNNTPFLMHNYEVKVDLPKIERCEYVSMYASIGEFAYL